ncbi:hypothetical protein [Bordetella tumulicola]|uniref:hypothetical protein n=1 Tax=Bordetella tumulicola TaxID=1649133 RepID=UPI0039F014C4
MYVLGLAIGNIEVGRGRALQGILRVERRESILAAVLGAGDEERGALAHEADGGSPARSGVPP